MGSPFRLLVMAMSMTVTAPARAATPAAAVVIAVVSSQHDSRAPRLYLCLCTSLCASRCHDDANGYHAIHSDDASNHGRASCHRPSSYRNCHDRLFVILPTAAG
ncbi:Uncharacterised protein [Klebsiella pneumoniae]|uniref:Secreted protein n=1 Tax=Klebsiella pneumoniae TaxID=573 RepID=A0A377XDS8_KLEPN|nr:Uncharacterised protein [Klebsiella pneumoniae]